MVTGEDGNRRRGRECEQMKCPVFNRWGVIPPPSVIAGEMTQKKSLTNQKNESITRFWINKPPCSSSPPDSIVSLSQLVLETCGVKLLSFWVPFAPSQPCIKFCACHLWLIWSWFNGMHCLPVCIVKRFLHPLAVCRQRRNSSRRVCVCFGEKRDLCWY